MFINKSAQYLFLFNVVFIQRISVVTSVSRNSVEITIIEIQTTLFLLSWLCNYMSYIESVMNRLWINQVIQSSHLFASKAFVWTAWHVLSSVFNYLSLSHNIINCRLRHIKMWYKYAMHTHLCCFSWYYCYYYYFFYQYRCRCVVDVLTQMNFVNVDSLFSHSC